MSSKHTDPVLRHADVVPARLVRQSERFEQRLLDRVQCHALLSRPTLCLILRDHYMLMYPSADAEHDPRNGVPVLAQQLVRSLLHKVLNAGFCIQNAEFSLTASCTS